MPPLERFTASGDVRNGPIATAPDPGAMARPWAAAGAVGGALQDTGMALSEVAARRQQEVDLTWATENAAKYYDELTERRQADESSPRETAGPEFKQFAEQRLAEISKTAPSKKAADIFSRHGREAISSGYRASLKLGEVTRITNAVAANDRAVAALVKSYQATAAYDSPENAASDVAPLVSLQLAGIEARFEQTAPELAAKMKERVVSEMVLGTAATNPNYARQLIAKSPIDEQSKLVLTHKVDSIEASANQVSATRFTLSLQDQLRAAAIDGSQIPEVPKTTFQAVYGKGWESEYERHEHARRIINTGNSVYAGMDGLNPSEQARKIGEIKASGTAAQKLAIPELIEKQRHSAKLADSDPAAWQHINDPEIREARELVNSLPPNARASAMQDVYRMMLERQGNPAPGAPNPERYLGLSEKHILGESDAIARKKAINNATIDEKFKFLAALEEEFGPLANDAYHDMLTLGNDKEKLSVAFRFASIIENPTTRRAFIAAQNNAKQIAGLNDEQKKEYTEALGANNEWINFGRGWMGENWQRNEDISDAQAAITTYAQALATAEGMTAKKAVDAAVKFVITDNYGFAKVNGQVIPISRRRGDGLTRPDSEISDIGRRLSVELRNIPVKELALNSPITGQRFYSALSPAFDINKQEDAQQLRNIITTQGYWVMSPGGDVVTLYVKEPGQEGFPVIDKDNQPLRFDLDELPLYQTQARDAYEDSIRRIYDSMTPEAKAKTSLEKLLKFRPVNSEPTPIQPSRLYRTNWPGLPSYYQRGLIRNFKVD